MEKPARHIEPSARATLLAQPVFFPQRFVFEQIIFAGLPAGEAITHHVAIDLQNRKLCCTCALRPRPCLHAQALYALHDREGDAVFTPAEVLPEWVGALLSGVPAANGASGPAGKTKQQRRFERLERAANGFEDLEAWLLDTARRGLAAIVSEDPKWWEGIAARMADASMTGLSRSLRLLGNIPASSPDWADRTAAVIADCYLAVRAFRKREDLPEPLLYDLQNFIGISSRKDEVLERGEKVYDVWAVAGQMEEPLEEKLTMRRTWLLGGKSGRYALLLDYAFGSDGLPPGFDPGSLRQGSLAFYPSAYPLRALADGDLETVHKKVEKLPGFEDTGVFAKSWAAALAQQPWLALFPAVLNAVTPQFRDGKFIAMDKNEKLLPLHVAGDTGWQLVALSGGMPVSIFGEWDGVAFRPLSAAAEGRFVVV